MLRFFAFLSFFFFAQNISAQHSPIIKITDLDKRLKNGGDTTFVVNFWATWCSPCVKELPYFVKTDSLYKDQKSKLILVSLDDDSDSTKVNAFLKRKKYGCTNYILDESNADYWIPFIDNDWQGAIPVTLFINTSTSYRAFFPRAMHEDEVKSEWEKSLKKQQ